MHGAGRVKNIFQGNNFPKHYHDLNIVFRFLHSYSKISNIFYKINFTYSPKS